MKSVLEELYTGNLDPETAYIKNKSDYTRSLSIMEDREGKLLKVLNEDSKKWLADFSDAHDTITSLTGLEQFSAGFKLGSLLMIEVFTGMDEIIHK